MPKVARGTNGDTFDASKIRTGDDGWLAFVNRPLAEVVEALWAAAANRRLDESGLLQRWKHVYTRASKQGRLPDIGKRFPHWAGAPPLDLNVQAAIGAWWIVLDVGAGRARPLPRDTDPLHRHLRSADPRTMLKLPALRGALELMRATVLFEALAPLVKALHDGCARISAIAAISHNPTRERALIPVPLFHDGHWRLTRPNVIECYEPLGRVLTYTSPSLELDVAVQRRHHDAMQRAYDASLAVGKKTGRKPQKREQVEAAMRTDITNGRRTLLELKEMGQKALAYEYDVSRYTALKALAAVLENPAKPIPDK